MKKVMLDTNAYDYIELNGLREKFLSALDKGEFELYYTHIQREQIEKIPDTKSEIRTSVRSVLGSAQLLSPSITIWTLQKKSNVPSHKSPTRIPSVSKHLAQMGYVDPNSSVMTRTPKDDPDAIIAETAAQKVDILVSEDRTLVNRFNKAKETSARAMSTLEFINSLQNKI